MAGNLQKSSQNHRATLGQTPGQPGPTPTFLWAISGPHWATKINTLISLVKMWTTLGHAGPKNPVFCDGQKAKKYLCKPLFSLQKTQFHPLIWKRCDPCALFLDFLAILEPSTRPSPPTFTLWAYAKKLCLRAAVRDSGARLAAIAVLAAYAAPMALSGAHASEGWTKLGTSWEDKSEQAIASLAPRLTTTGWSWQDSFDERGKPSSPKPNVKSWKRPEAGSGLTGLRALITLAESQRDGYDAIHHSATRLPGKRPSEMTIGEIFAWIDATPGQHHAIGFYQIIPSTLKSLVARSGISPQVKFSVRTQDYLGDILIADAGFNEFVSGELKASRFMDNLAKIWAGLPMANGRSAYHGKAGNRASVSRAFFEREMTRIFKPETSTKRAAKIRSLGAER